MIREKISKIRTIVIKSNTNIEKAITKLNFQEIKFLIVVSSKKLEGTLTDSDLRRKGVFKNKKDTVKQVYNPKPKFVYFNKNTNTNCQKIFEKFNFIDAIPIVNSKKEVIEIAFRRFYQKKENVFLNNKDNSKIDVLILAGGLGARIKEITVKTPKPLISFKNEPYLVKLIKKINQYNFNNIFVSLCYMKNFFQNVLKKNFPEEIKFKKISFILEKTPLGTAGCIKNIKSKKNNNILILNSDVIFNLNLQYLIDDHNYNKSFITIAVKPYSVKIPFGIVDIDKRGVKSLQEKPTKTYFISVGIYVVNQEVKKLIKKNERIDMPNLIMRAKKRGLKINYFLMNEDALDFGTYENLSIAKEKFENFF